MLNIKVFLLGIFLVMLGAGGAALCAEEPGSKGPEPGALSENAAEKTKSILRDLGGSPEGVEEVNAKIDSVAQMAQQDIRDPFATEEIKVETAADLPAAPAGPEIKVELQGIGFGSKDAYAIIGGEVFYVGDEKSGIKLLEVRRREVDILVNGGSVTVSLFPAQDLQKAKDRAQRKGVVKEGSLSPRGQAPSVLSQKEQLPV